MAPSHAEGIALAAFVKTPRLSPVKTRLAKTVGEEAAVAFYELSCQAVAGVMEQCAGEGFHPYWAVAEPDGLASWPSFAAVWQGEGGLGERLATVYENLYRRHGAVCLIGADCPQIDVGLFRQAKERLARHEFVIGPATDGGFYLFASRVALPASVWTSVGYSASTTCQELETALQPYGKVEHLQILTDVDEEPDLAIIERDLRRQTSTRAQDATAAHTNLLSWLTKRGTPE